MEIQCERSNAITLPSDDNQTNIGPRSGPDQVTLRDMPAVGVRWVLI